MFVLLHVSGILVCHHHTFLRADRVRVGVAAHFFFGARVFRALFGLLSRRLVFVAGGPAGGLPCSVWLPAL